VSNRRTKERARVARSAPRDLPVNTSRLRRLFVKMEHRGTKPFKDLVFGPEVEARTPEELVERMDEAFVAEILKQRQS
jgi:hypothetical protein